MHSRRAFDSPDHPNQPASSFDRFYQQPRDTMIFQPMQFASSRPDMGFDAVSAPTTEFQGLDPYLSPGFAFCQQLHSSPRSLFSTEIPIKRMERQSPVPTRLTESPDSVVYNIPIHVEGRDDGHAVPQRQFPSTDRRPQSPRTRTPDQQIPAADAANVRQLRPGVSASKQRSVTPEVSRQEAADFSRNIPVHMDTSSKPRDRSNSPAPLPKKKKTPQEQIAEANARLQELRQEVECFSGSSSDKQYRYLDEMLTRLLISLDNVDTEGNEQLRLARKETVRSIQKCADVLESKGKENVVLSDEQVNDEMSQSEPDAPAAEQTSPPPVVASNTEDRLVESDQPHDPDADQPMEAVPSDCDDGHVESGDPIPTATSDDIEAKAEAETCSNESHL